MSDISIKGRSPLLKGGRVGFKKGAGYSIKTKKVKPGYDQEFTLPKGTSAAPIKQSKSYVFSKKTIKHMKKFDKENKIMKDKGYSLTYQPVKELKKGKPIGPYLLMKVWKK
tara:strand:+ start:170 stop:502 length:333 start_codon:yes stop_codon:yes gene_type:complete